MDLKTKLNKGKELITNVNLLKSENKLYFRVKKSSTKGTKFLPEIPEPITVYVDGEGVFILTCCNDFTISITDKKGDHLYDKSIVFKVKHSRQYKNFENKIESHQAYCLNHEIEYYDNFYEQSCPTDTREVCDELLQCAEREVYIRDEFDVPYPSEDSVANELRQIAKSEMSSVKFWERGQLVEQYVYENLASFLQEKINQWNEERKAFEENENKRYKSWRFENQNKKARLKSLLSKDENFTTKEIYDWVDKLELPFDFGLGIEYANDIIICNVKAPGINIIPQKCGKVKTDKSVVKNREKKEINNNYYNFILGILFFVVSNVLSIAIGFDTSIVNIYDGDRKGSCIFTARFTRKELSELTGNENVAVAISKFRTWSDVKEDKTFKHIETIKN